MYEQHFLKKITIEFENGDEILIHSSAIKQVNMSVAYDGPSTLDLSLYIDSVVWTSTQARSARKARLIEHSVDGKKVLPFSSKQLPEHEK